jgi:hypothetical protein
MACKAAKSICMHKIEEIGEPGARVGQTRIISAQIVYKTSWIAFERISSKSDAPMYKNGLRIRKKAGHRV